MLKQNSRRQTRKTLSYYSPESSDLIFTYSYPHIKDPDLKFRVASTISILCLPWLEQARKEKAE